MNYTKRKRLRAKGYDYSSPGSYFITICTQDRQPLFGQIVDGEMKFNELGQIIWNEWQQTPIVRPHVKLDAFVIIPDHIHGIIILTNVVGATRRVAPTTRRVAPTTSNVNRNP